MATDSRPPKIIIEPGDSGGGSTPPAPPTQQSGQAQALIVTPVFYERKGCRNKKGKGRKRRYSRGTKGIQKLILGASRAAYRTANSFADGFNTFAKRSNRSARRKKDGLIRYSLRNASRGIQDGFDQLGKAPNAIAKQIGTNNVRRGFRIVFNPFGR